MNDFPILYSFRRCPYAIRARLAIKVSNIQVELREVVLADKPDEMLLVSPKGTVPILILADGSVIEESRDIMQWALEQNDPHNWLCHDQNKQDENKQDEINSLINMNDGEFKIHLDHYKYADRFPERPMESYRTEAEVFLQKLERQLNKTQYLMGNSISLADMAIFPFIRQFAFVDKGWFAQTGYIKLQQWLETRLSETLFLDVMMKYPQWKPNNTIQMFA